MTEEPHDPRSGLRLRMAVDVRAGKETLAGTICGITFTDPPTFDVLLPGGRILKYVARDSITPREDAP